MKQNGTRQAFEIGGTAVQPASRRTVELPISALSDHTPMSLPVHVVHGRHDGPVMFVSAAVHGDEILGVEIVRRLLKHRALSRLSGTLMAVPIVNAYGFINRSRYLLDRRDLNRSFPGSDRGSLSGLLAELFMREVVARSQVGIDLHTAALHRTNLPQIRISPGSERLMALAGAFGAPVTLVSRLREGSLRKAALDLKVDMLLYEAGEALRLDEVAIRGGVVGVLRVMKHLGMIEASRVGPGRTAPALSHSSFWLRAPGSGIFRAFRSPGDRVGGDEVIGAIADPFGRREVRVRSDRAGIIIGRTNLPVVNRGDALFHIAEVDRDSAAHPISGELEADTLFDEDEIL
jgi:hypothetical protein